MRSTQQPNQPPYDIFIAAADVDRQAAETIAQSVGERGLNVFLDDGQTSEPLRAEDALNQSRLLIPYYSQNFVTQPHCHRALMSAFLAGQHSGNVLKYIAAINPDDPVFSHITPLEIANARYAVPGADLSFIADAVRAKAAQNSVPIGQVPEVTDPEWVGAIAPMGDMPAAQRYKELWQLHNNLTRDDFLFISNEVPNGLAAVCGPRGSGKTSFVAAYAKLFGAQFQGGVYWTSLAGCESTGEAIQERYDAELRKIQALGGLAHKKDIAAQPLESIADYLRKQPAPSLWVVDDIPRGYSEEDAYKLIPGEQRLQTVLISRDYLMSPNISRIALESFTNKYFLEDLQTFEW